MRYLAFQESSEPGIMFCGPEKDPIALVIRSNYEKRNNGAIFFSQTEWNFQIGFIKQPANHIFPEHSHNATSRLIYGTEEVLLIRKGACLVQCYGDREDAQKQFFETELHSGDLVIFRNGGHKIIVKDDVEILEVKQGPYLGSSDKTRTNFLESNDSSK